MKKYILFSIVAILLLLIVNTGLSFAYQFTQGDEVTKEVYEENQDIFPTYTPNKTNIYIELDWSENCDKHHLNFDRLEQEFENHGYALHIIEGREVPEIEIPTLPRLLNYKNQYFSREGKGYYYAVIGDGSTGVGTQLGLMSGHCISEEDIKQDIMTEEEFQEVTPYQGPQGRMTSDDYEEYRDYTIEDRINRSHLRMESQFSHELGHSMGLMRPVYEGIDSEHISFEDYPSSMNYNYNQSYIGYSDGGEFNDWKWLEQNLKHPPDHNLGASQFKTVLFLTVYAASLGSMLLIYEILRRIYLNLADN